MLKVMSSILPIILVFVLESFPNTYISYIKKAKTYLASSYDFFSGRSMLYNLGSPKYPPWN